MRRHFCDCEDPTVHDWEKPAVLLRDTPEDRERLLEALWPGDLLEPRESVEERVDAILAALRERR